MVQDILVIYLVTQSKLYNDHYNPKKVQENRMRKLIGEDIEADEYEIPPTGKIVCIVCPYHPILENAEIFLV